MNALKRPDIHELIVLHARTAEDLMTTSPVSIEEDASIWKVWEWPQKVRWGRLFQPIR